MYPQTIRCTVLLAALLAVSGYFLPVVPSRNIRTPVYLSGRPGVYGGVLPPVDRSSNNNGWGNWGDEGESEGEGNDLGKDLLRGGFFLDLWNSYEDVLEERPILTKAVTSFIGFSVGDIIAQTLVGTDPFDPKRLARMASFGFLIHGTVSHFFYGFLDGQFPGTTAAIVFLKVFIDQVLWNPIFGVLFFSYIGLASGDAPTKIVETIKEKLLTAVTASWKVWPVAHAINFRFIPTEQRLLYINSIQICYNVFLSVLGSSKK